MCGVSAGFITVGWFTTLIRILLIRSILADDGRLILLDYPELQSYIPSSAPWDLVIQNPFKVSIIILFSAKHGGAFGFSRDNYGV